MSIVGVVDVLRGKPHNPVGPDGRMALSDHFRELRARLIRSALFLVIAVLRRALLLRPAARAGARTPTTRRRSTLEAEGHRTEAVVHDATGGLLLQMKLCGVVALIAASPYWLYQIWAFVLPGPAPQREEVLPDLRGASPGRCSSAAWRSATTCCPRASRS